MIWAYKAAPPADQMIFISSSSESYTVNSRYVMSVRRYEAALITGEALPIPFHNYMQVKAELERRTR